MKTKTLILIIVALVAGYSTFVQAGIGVRAGAMFPRGDFDEFAGNGTRVELYADLKILPIPLISEIISISNISFGDVESHYVSDGNFVNQKSGISASGIAVGLRLAPNAVIFSPFAEAQLRLTKVEQDYSSGTTTGSSVDSSTKLGYQINVGLMFSFVPKVSLEAGVTWMTVRGVDLITDQQKIDTNVEAFGIFGGLNLGIGL